MLTLTRPLLKACRIFRWRVLGLVVAIVAVAPSVRAHVSVSGPATANTTHEAVFGVSHGCDGADTVSLKVTIPAGVTSVRPLNGDLGKAVVEKDGTGAVTSVTWTRPDDDVGSDDTHFYKAVIRMRIPDAPFTTIYFPTVQTCKTAQGEVRSISWTATAGGDHGDHGTHTGGQGMSEPAPALLVLPLRLAGWNKFTLNQHIHDMSVFKDAQIVWSGTAAYSINPVTMDLIKKEPGVTILSELHPGSEVWVKY